MVDTFYKLRTLTQKILSHWLLGKVRVRILWASGLIFSTKWSIHNLLCVFLFNDTWLTICCWVIHIGHMAVFQAWMKLISPMSSTTFLYFRMPDNTLALKLGEGSIVKSKITNNMHKDKKNVALNRLWKGCLFTVWRLQQEGQASPCMTAAGLRHRWWKSLAALRLSKSEGKSPSEC